MAKADSGWWPNVVWGRQVLDKQTARMVALALLPLSGCGPMPFSRSSQPRGSQGESHTHQAGTWREACSLAISCPCSCQRSSYRAPRAAASQRSTLVPVIPSDSCQLLGVQSAEREPLVWQIPTGLGPVSCLVCWYLESQFVLRVRIKWQWFMQLFLWAASAMLLLPLICKGVKGDQSGSPRTYLPVSSLSSQRRRLFFQRQLLRALTLKSLLYLLWGLVVRCWLEGPCLLYTISHPDPAIQI